MDEDEALIRGIVLLPNRLEIASPADEPRRTYELPDGVDVVEDGSGEPWLECRYSLPARPAYANPARDALSEFIRVDQGSLDRVKERVKALAVAWGPLGLCEKHGALRAHDASCRPVSEEPEPGISITRERVSDWVSHARHLRALLNIAHHLQQERPGLAEDWEAVWSTGPFLGNERFRIQDRYTETLNVAIILNHWLRRGSVRAVASWPSYEPRPAVGLTYAGLAGILAIELAATLQSGKGVFVCAACKMPFTPKQGNRGRRAGVRAWCEQCGRHAQWRTYQKERYRNLKTPAS